jgi:hypothetical protein
MKKHILIILLVSFLISCHKDKNNNGNGISIKGNIPANGPVKKSILASESSLTLADAKSVLVFYGEQYSISEIVNGSFSTNAPMGCAAALIFLDANNHYIGNLNVSGLNMLPLVNLSNSDQTVIDLSSLSLDGTNVLPSNNPIGSEILITQQDITLYKELGSYFEALAKNIDTDNDGIPDNFSGKELMVNTLFNINLGTCGLNSTPPMMIDTSQLIVNYGVRFKGFNNLVPQNLNISLTGPEGAPYTDIVKNNYEYNSNCGCFDVFFSRQTQSINGGATMLPFKQGIYTFSMDGTQNHTISYSSINAKYFLVLAVPTFKTDNQGNVTNVTIDYMLPDKTPAQPSKFITTLMLQFQDANMNQIYQEGSIFSTTSILPDFKNVALTTPVKLSNINALNISYTDLVGNIYNLFWQHP